jgi:hypothetical protein
MKIKNLAYAALVGVAAVAIVIGSAVPSEAAKKKKAAAAPPPPAQQWPTCWGAPYGPVCATKGGQKFTYVNSCYAMKDQATSAKPGACKAAKAGGKKKKAKKKKK